MIRQRDAVHLLLAQEEVGRRDARGGGGEGRRREVKQKHI